MALQTISSHEVAEFAYWVANTSEVQIAYFSYNLIKKNEGWEVLADGRSKRYC